MIQREITKRIFKSKNNILLLGARQVGKTTILKQLKPAKFINLADESEYISYSKDPSKLLRELRAFKGSGIVAIDEIQRIPRLLNNIQVLIDEKSRFRFIITGSSARKLKKGHANLLPGRIVMEYLDPLTIEEIGDKFELAKALQTGTLPGIYFNKETGADILEYYSIIYLKEEIQAESIARDIGSYSRFLDVAAQSSGQWVNFSKLSNDAEIPKETIRRYYSVLEDTLVAFRIPSFAPKRSKRRVTQKDKYLIFDIGVRNALLKLHKNALSPNEIGPIFEQFVMLQIIYFNRAHKKQWEISSYRTEGGAEVDIIVDTGDRYLAIECKSGHNINDSGFSGLKSFEEVANKKVNKYVVYTGKNRQLLRNNILAVPVKEFFLEEINKY